MQTIYQLKKIYRRLQARIPIAQNVLNRAVGPISYMRANAHLGSLLAMDANFPKFLMARNIPFGTLPVTPHRCALPKKKQRELGLLPHLPNPNLALAA